MIVVATTLAAFAMDDPDTWGSWLRNAEAMRTRWGPGVRFFAAIETDARGLAPFDDLVARMVDVVDSNMLDGGVDWWTFQLDDGRTEVTTANRLRHITAGQNLCVDYALSHPDCTHLLFLAADLEPPADALEKLVEVDHPLVGGHVPTYCLDGPRLIDKSQVGGTAGWLPDGMDLRVHMPTAAFVLIRRDLLRFVRWRWDLDAGMSDDPCLHHDARTFHGVEALVRHDCVGTHHPEAIPRIEDRGHDLTVHREFEGSAPDPAWVDHHAAGRGA